MCRCSRGSASGTLCDQLEFPTCENYWKQDDVSRPTWQNYYATQWADSKASAEYALSNWDRLYAETKLFKDTLFGSTMPPAAIDAIAGNIAILKSPTCLRLEDGTFTAGKGCTPTLAVAKGAAPTSGTINRRCPSSSRNSNAPCAPRITSTTCSTTRDALPHPTAPWLGSMELPCLL
ncbi:MAG: hypothetical protein R2867_03495 [Caldilineaceae bacterium]